MGELRPNGGLIDSGHYRRVLRRAPTGVVVVTSVVGGQPVGMTIGSFTSVSLEPPLVAFCARDDSSTWAQIRAAGAFCVNVLGADQELVARRFAERDVDRFAGIAWHASPAGLPVVAHVIAWIDCELHEVVGAGDHAIVLGAVTALDLDRVAGTPLVFFDGGYGGCGAHRAVRPVWGTAVTQPAALGGLGG